MDSRNRAGVCPSLPEAVKAGGSFNVFNRHVASVARFRDRWRKNATLFTHPSSSIAKKIRFLIH
jgi:hypothetical protein